MEISELKNWIDCSQFVIESLRFDSSDRKVVSASFLHLSFEHHVSIYHLLKIGNHGSAFALLRPQKEAFIKGIWLLRCANDEQVVKFMKEDKLPAMKKLFRDVEQTKGYKHGYLSKHLNSINDLLHDYTHGGSIQTSSRYQGEKISSIYSQGQQEWLMVQSKLLSFLSALELCHVSDSPIESKLITHVYGETSP
ncbi:MULTISPECIES: DUF6988 family protein [Vibrio harveyi group]|uniref:DUF6988 family protein n=1 Tax=Vibrio harveyi group TaxID=717610 RepID=UPI0006A659A0|nr:hypothetical protein [Vibrio parahaemolyticus]ELB2784587.1 hypothetical protein [Vibrio alginolyticus]ELN6908208.1 hypothetical protein [Vibrio alginolyticus]KOF29186.1 hypothetical protein ACX13_12980 [Vibrio parahaemolyticus]MDG2600567.1 hypothetical protein [Vibrio parahaemolyticus]MDL2005453.1 hypothetical protein [Vibrio parahaemolyticus]